MRKLQLIFSLLLLSTFYLSYAQSTSEFNASPGSFVIDETKGIIIVNIDAMASTPRTLKSVVLDKKYLFDSEVDELTSLKSYNISAEGIKYKLFITKSPLLSITSEDSLVEETKKAVTFTYFDADTSFTSAAGMRLRGNLSLTYPKKSFSVEFYEDDVSKKKKDVKFKKLYKDDDWILDGLYNEPLLLNSYVNQKLWKDIHPPSYASEAPKAESTVDGIFVDLFINKSYQGVYFLSEKISRTLLKLEKPAGNIVQGELFKAETYLPGTSFEGVSEFKNSLPKWNGFAMEYPYEDFTSHWDDLYKSIEFAVNSTDSDFETNIQNYFSVENLVDYFLFVNVIRATDNLGKNYYLARYRNNTPYFFVPWDLDGTLGTILEGRRIETTNDILSNHLFDRLLKSEVYRSKLKQRWNVLRKDILSDTSLVSRIEDQYQALKDKKFYERDEMVWNKSHNEEHLLYTKDWLLKRLKYLDEYFEVNSKTR